MVPIILKLKKTAHKETAKAQDIIVEELYKIFDNAVIHGGTAIWRCYQGNRFSEDIDVYLKKDEKKLHMLFENLEKRGFGIEKKRIKDNSLYSTLKLGRTSVRFEALFKEANGSLKEYETADGNIIMVYTLKAEELIHEKVNAYLKREKIRDFYDIFFLLRHVKEKNNIKEDIKRLLRDFKKSADRDNLKILILEGIVPDENKMLQYIKASI